MVRCNKLVRRFQCVFSGNVHLDMRVMVLNERYPLRLIPRQTDRAAPSDSAVNAL